MILLLYEQPTAGMSQSESTGSPASSRNIKSPHSDIYGNLSSECRINELSEKIASDISAIKPIRLFTNAEKCSQAPADLNGDFMKRPKLKTQVIRSLRHTWSVVVDITISEIHTIFSRERLNTQLPNVLGFPQSVV